ncbi:MAG: hypothetical protein LUI87_05330 [Lachnospiraceae bacterium]|nr:hypothetical protein [Lachnospiraceae bacterium]
MFEYDSQLALTVAVMESNEHTGGSFLLRFPYSAILLLEGGKKQGDRLSCTLELPDLQLPCDLAENTPAKQPQEASLPNHAKQIEVSKFITKIRYSEYSVALVKVQAYEIQDIYDRQLYILIPFMPIRFSRLAKKRGSDTGNDQKTIQELENAKKQLTVFYQDIILILSNAVADGHLGEPDLKIILALLRKAMIRVFYKDKDLLEEVIHLTAPVLELEWETIARLEKEVAEKDSALARAEAERNSALARAEAEKDRIEAEKATIEAEKATIEAERDSALAKKDEEIDMWRAIALGKVKISKRSKRRRK